MKETKQNEGQYKLNGSKRKEAKHINGWIKNTFKMLFNLI